MKLVFNNRFVETKLTNGLTCEVRNAFDRHDRSICQKAMMYSGNLGG